MSDKIKHVEQGHCPNCGVDGLEYEEVSIDGESLCYPFICNLCNFEGEEWYNMEFVSYVYYPKGEFAEVYPGQPLIKQLKKVKKK